MDLDRARFLVTDEGAALLDAARRTRDLAPHRRPEILREHASAEDVRTALQQDDLRRRALARLPDAERLLFTPGALEQATAWAVAEERAKRWPAPPAERLVDLTAGVGLDTLAAARAGRPVLAVEKDPARALLLRHNAAALGLQDRIEVETGDAGAPGRRGPLAFLDPDRRPEGRRTRDASRLSPARDEWPGILSGFRASMIKLPPSPEAPFDGPQELVSLDGRLRERRLLLGDFGAPPRRALRLPGGQAVAGEGVAWPEPGDIEPGLWLLDPDPGVTVLDLVGDLALRDGLRPVHSRIAYLLGEAPNPAAPGVWVRIEACLPPRPRDLDRWLSAADVGRLTIRTRGVEARAEGWRRRLHPRGGGAGTLVFTRNRANRWIVVAGREPSAL